MRKKLIECPDCDCVFLTEKDLLYHLLSHIPSPKPPDKKILPLELRRREYAEELRLFRLDHCQPGQYLSRKSVRPEKRYWGDRR